MGTEKRKPTLLWVEKMEEEFSRIGGAGILKEARVELAYVAHLVAHRQDFTNAVRDAEITKRKLSEQVSKCKSHGDEYLSLKGKGDRKGAEKALSLLRYFKGEYNDTLGEYTDLLEKVLTETKRVKG